jgi:hypothetical protein
MSQVFWCNRAGPQVVAICKVQTCNSITTLRVVPSSIIFDVAFYPSKMGSWLCMKPLHLTAWITAASISANPMRYYLPPFAHTQALPVPFIFGVWGSQLPAKTHTGNATVTTHQGLQARPYTEVRNSQMCA